MTNSAEGVRDLTPERPHIQGNVLRGYRVKSARHFALQITSRTQARSFVRELTSGGGDGLRITMDLPGPEDPRPKKQSVFLNIGFTWEGLRALGVVPAVLEAFPEAYQEGPAARARLLGDDQQSDPRSWVMGGPLNPPVHILLSVYAKEAGSLPAVADSLLKLALRHALVKVHVQDAEALDEGTVHFGFRDSLSQPRIEGIPPKEDAPADLQPECKAGEFLLGRGYENQFRGNFLGDLPPTLGDNGTYAAFRILKQNVREFEDYITLTGKRFGMDPELVAAKMVGRWRNGIPLVLSPKKPCPDSPVSDADLNAFDYASSERAPSHFHDDEGVRCPIGCHIRRMNPRSSAVVGKPHSRRLIRRGMPYGPRFDPSQPDDVERGLVGLFICGDVEQQFEFVQRIYANLDLHAPGIRDTRDPLLGAHPREGGKFVIRTDDHRDPIILHDVPRFVETRGSAYCFVPGLAGLRYLSSDREEPS